MHSTVSLECGHHNIGVSNTVLSWFIRFLLEQRHLDLYSAMSILVLAISQENMLRYLNKELLLKLMGYLIFIASEIKLLKQRPKLVKNGLKCTRWASKFQKNFLGEVRPYLPRGTGISPPTLTCTHVETACQ